MATRSESATTNFASRCNSRRRVQGRKRVAAFLSLSAATVLAQGAPPWTLRDRPGLPDDARSVTIVRKNEPIFTSPDSSAPRRGAAAIGARLPLYGARRGPGCRSDWLLVGPVAWMCGDATEVSTEPPLSADSDTPSSADGLPEKYSFIGDEGALAYADLASAGEEAPTEELQPGFAVSITETRNGPRGDPFSLTTKGLWIAAANLVPVRPLDFHGYAVIGGELDHGWVVADVARVHATPGEPKLTGAVRRRFETFPVLESRDVKGRTWVRVAEGAWLDGDDVRVPVASAPPAEARAGERWLDVDLEHQVVTAYEGERAVYTTLTSTGVGRGDDVTATPLGVHRIWVKLRTTDMTNLEDAEARRYYAIEDVPWVMFFQKGYGFHGAFWHRSFGHVRSHGCVNLTPLDAEQLFRWASPRLPAGWTAVLPTEYDPGTLVRVR